MVKIAISGASGSKQSFSHYFSHPSLPHPTDVAQELLDYLVTSKKHEIVLLSRKAAGPTDVATGVTWIQTDYHDPAQVVEALAGVHTLLCFITPQSDPGNTSQKNLIDAAVKAGVKRYAPSEWAS
jgi:uncharacterized protein YbjT (DUF2867 family)